MFNSRLLWVFAVNIILHGVASNRQMLSVSYNAYAYGEDQSNN